MRSFVRSITVLASIAGLATLAPEAGAQRRARLAVEPKQPGTGELVRLTLDRLDIARDSIVRIDGTMAGEPLHFRRGSGDRMQALGAVPTDASDSVVARVVIERASGATDSARVFLKYPHHAPPAPLTKPARTRVSAGKARRLTVDRRFTQRNDSVDDARVEHENELARDAGRRTHDTPPLWTLPFLRPRPSKITSRFGSGRLFNGRVSSSHGGIDFRGAVGEPVVAANRGVVALVAEFFLAGNVVYIDHGGGLLTGYFHLSRTEVAVGDTVERGQEIGLVGATGRVTGPHLHWSARYGAITVDPAALLALQPPFVTALPVTADGATKRR